MDGINFHDQATLYMLNNNSAICYVAQNVDMPPHDATLYKMFRSCDLEQQAIIERLLCQFTGMNPKEFEEKEKKEQ